VSPAAQEKARATREGRAAARELQRSLPGATVECCWDFHSLCQGHRADGTGVGGSTDPEDAAPYASCVCACHGPPAAAPAPATTYCSKTCWLPAGHTDRHRP
jgi:hypothetical protein